MILGLESSCDETAAAVVDGRRVVSNVIASQIEMHAAWGGVVPEAAARAHVEALLPTIEKAMRGVPWSQIDRIAVTNRPGLVGALSVAVTAAVGLGALHRIPVQGVHHLEGHLASVLAVAEPELPIVSLVASGGHTEIVLTRAWGSYEILGETRDDAAGEAFDKAARLMGLGYPGGPAVERVAREGVPGRYKLPRGLSGETREFSFSGLKTAVLRMVEAEGASLDKPSLALALQTAVVDVLVERTVRAARDVGARTVALVGGVAANSALRSAFEKALVNGPTFLVPPFDLCTDNAAMIALAAARCPRDDSPFEILSGAPLPR